ncbi:MAG: hypothetical protein KF784_14085 [Fimbriimonadaceae bacterium]|nr:hypothetical protein [Fimbriimonadaceae bacterium]
MLSALGLAAAIAQTPEKVQLPPPRFQMSAPLQGAPQVMLDRRMAGWGYANELAKANNLQSRMLWIDGTANLERVGSVEKIDKLIAQIKDSGFNTVVFDVKPISGQVLYKSKISPKILEWKGQKLSPDFDPLEVMAPRAKAAGLSFFVSLNAFSEGHNLFTEGPGYQMLDLQSVIYEAVPQVITRTTSFDISQTSNKMPDGEDSLGAFTDASKLPTPDPALFAVTLTPDLRVVDGFAGAGVKTIKPTIPRQGIALVGRGKAAQFLKEHVWPGDRIKLDTRAQFVRTGERPSLQYPLMMNPHNGNMQQRALDIASELIRNYKIDGIVYDDRLRYAGLYADFSESTRAEFERLVGKRLQWPQDVFRYTYTTKLEKGLSLGPYYDAWMAFRAMTLRKFVQRARAWIRSIQPDAQLGVYAGSWYGEYPSLGNNWAGDSFDGGFWFLTPEYQKTGYASDLDFLVTGCYYKIGTIHQALEDNVGIGATVEAAGYLSARAVRDSTWTVAGIMLSQFKDDPEGLMNVLQGATGTTQGVMVFDLSHDIEPFWPVFKRAFVVPANSPHKRPDVLETARKRRKQIDAMGKYPPPVIITAGSSGTGQ